MQPFSPARDPRDLVPDSHPAPAGWRLGMTTCNLLMAATFLVFAGYFAVKVGLLGLLY